MRSSYAATALFGAQAVSGYVMLLGPNETVSQFASTPVPKPTGKVPFMGPELSVSVGSTSKNASTSVPKPTGKAPFMGPELSVSAGPISTNVSTPYARQSGNSSSKAPVVFTTIADFTTVTPTPTPMKNSTSSAIDVTSFVHVTVTMKPSARNFSGALSASSGGFKKAASPPSQIPRPPMTTPATVGKSTTPARIVEPVHFPSFSLPFISNHGFAKKSGSKLMVEPTPNESENQSVGSPAPESEEHEDEHQDSAEPTSSFNKGSSTLTITQYSTTTSKAPVQTSSSSQKTSKPTSSAKSLSSMTTKLTPTSASPSSSHSTNLVSTVLSAGPRCPYPYPGIYCGPQKTTMVSPKSAQPTSTPTEASPTKDDMKPQKTGSGCPFLYPGKKSC